MASKKEKILEWLNHKISFLETIDIHGYVSSEKESHIKGKLTAFKETKSHIENFMRD